MSEIGRRWSERRLINKSENIEVFLIKPSGLIPPISALCPPPSDI